MFSSLHCAEHQLRDHGRLHRKIKKCSQSREIKCKGGDMFFSLFMRIKSNAYMCSCTQNNIGGIER